jgi:hypothetical protein
MVALGIRNKITLGDLRVVAKVLWDQELSSDGAMQFSLEWSVLEKSFGDRRLISYLRSNKQVDKISQFLYFYVLTKDALITQDVEDNDICDYVSTLLVDFGEKDRSLKSALYSDDKYFNITEILEASKRFDGGEKFKLFVHLGNFALWQAGMFSKFVERRGESISFYDTVGQKGYKMAAVHPLGIADQKLYDKMSDRFKDVRVALNHLSNDILT